jgi:hypothetical protein
MATKNDITGDSLTSKASTKAYDDGWDRIFGKKNDADLGLEGDTRMTSKERHEEEFNTKAVHPAEVRYPHLRDKNQKEKQQDMTELNGDGNRERGRNGEDLTNN